LSNVRGSGSSRLRSATMQVVTTNHWLRCEATNEDKPEAVTGRKRQTSSNSGGVSLISSGSSSLFEVVIPRNNVTGAIEQQRRSLAAHRVGIDDAAAHVRQQSALAAPPAMT